MKKQLLVSTLALCVLTATTSIASAATTTFGKSLEKDFKQAGQETKGTFKSIGESMKTDVENSAKEVKKQKINTLKQQKAAALDDIDAKIKAKKVQISEVKKSTSLLETQKTTRLSIYGKELEYLQTRRLNIVKSYDNRINSLK